MPKSAMIEQEMQNLERVKAKQQKEIEQMVEYELIKEQIAQRNARKQS